MCVVHMGHNKLKLGSHTMPK